MSTAQKSLQTANALYSIREFIPLAQRQTLTDLCRHSEEKDFFCNMIIDLAARIQAMPKTYEQQDKGAQAIVYLHYFYGNCDWYITEKDMGTADEPGQHQAYGWADIGYGGEYGYTSIVELQTIRGVELDLYWTPKPLAEVIHHHEQKHAAV